MQKYADIYSLQNYCNMFRVSQHPSSGALKIVPAASGTGHTTCTATPLQFLILLMMGAVTPETC